MTIGYVDYRSIVDGLVHFGESVIDVRNIREL